MNKIENAIMNLKSLDNQADLYGFQIDTINLAIEALERQLNNGWIPTKQRLPNMKECQKNDCRFIVTDGNRVYGDSFDYLADGYIEPKWVYSSMCEPIAWQELPERYKEVKNE